MHSFSNDLLVISVNIIENTMQSLLVTKTQCERFSASAELVSVFCIYVGNFKITTSLTSTAYAGATITGTAVNFCDNGLHMFVKTSIIK